MEKMRYILVALLYCVAGISLTAADDVIYDDKGIAYKYFGRDFSWWYGFPGVGYVVGDNTQYRESIIRLPKQVSWQGENYDIVATGLNFLSDIDDYNYGFGYFTTSRPGGVDFEPSYVYSGNKYIREVDLTNCTELLVIDKFSECVNLETVNCYNLPKLRYVGGLMGCKNLKYVNLSGCKSLETIDSNAFFGDSHLSEINLSGCDNLSYIGSYAFASCTSLEAFDFSRIPRLSVIGSRAFYNTKLKTVDLSQCKNLTFPSGRVAGLVEEGFFAECRELQTANLSNLKSIKILYSTFQCCTSLERVNLTGCDSITEMTRTFEICESLSEIEFTKFESLTKIGAFTFSKCLSLSSLDLSGCTSLTTIDGTAFAGRNGLMTLKLPKSLSSIGVLGDCSLETIVCYAGTPPTFIRQLNSAEDNHNPLPDSMIESGTLYVPTNSVELYKNAYGWKDAYRILPMSALVNTNPIEKIELSPENLTIAETSDAFVIDARISPWNASQPEVSWEIEPAGVLETVDIDPTTLSIKLKPVGRGIGECIVRARAQNRSAESRIVITPIEDKELVPTDSTVRLAVGSADEIEDLYSATVQNPVICGSDIIMQVGQTASMQIVPTPRVEVNPSINWDLPGADMIETTMASDDGYAVRFTALAMGETAYKATFMGNEEMVVEGRIIVVPPYPITGLTLDEEEFSISTISEPVCITATLEQLPMSQQKLEWKVSPEGMVTVEHENGDDLSTHRFKIIPLGQGDCVLSVRMNQGGEISASCAISVKELTGLQITPGEKAVDHTDAEYMSPAKSTAGKIASIRGTDITMRESNTSPQFIVKPVPDVTYAPKDISWKIEDTSIATIQMTNGNPYVAGIKSSRIGTTRYSICVDKRPDINVCGELKIIYEHQIDSFYLELGEIAAQTICINAIPVNRDNSRYGPKILEWSVDDETILSVNEQYINNPKYCYFNRVGTGKVTITARDLSGSELSAQYTITLNDDDDDKDNPEPEPIQMVWDQTFHCNVGEKFRLEAYSVAGNPIAYEARVHMGNIVNFNFEQRDGEWYATALSDGTCMLRAYETDSPDVYIEKQIIAVSDPDNLFYENGIYYRYLTPSGAVPELKVVRGYELYSGDIHIPSKALGMDVVAIEDQTFNTCPALGEVYISEGVRSIGDHSFGCSTLSAIHIPGSVTSIAAWAFNVSENIMDIYLYGITPVKVGEEIFNGFTDYSVCRLHIPSGTLAAYRQAEVWKNFRNIIEDLTPTSLENIAGDGNTISIDVYSVAGVWVKHLNHIDGLKSLEPGFYIVRSGTKVWKVKI